jgi:opacity protein-like surface antigen
MAMRRLILTLSMAAAFAAAAQPTEAQLSYGLQAAMLTGLEEVTAGPDLNGTFGIGPRVIVAPPLFPVGLVGQGVYYFPEGDGSYMTYGLGAILRLPLPMISPYVIGGWQWRRSGNGTTTTENGPTVGLGVQLNVAMPIFLEATMEFNDEIPSAPDFDVNPLVIQGGVLLGG